MRPASTNIEFTTTRWSLVVASARPSGVRFRAALDKLTRQYRDAIVVFIFNYYRCSTDEAEDVAQEFIVRWIERGFANVSRDRGRFRSYLCGALRHFVQNWRRDMQTQRRGGTNARPGRSCCRSSSARRRTEECTCMHPSKCMSEHERYRESRAGAMGRRIKKVVTNAGEYDGTVVYFYGGVAAAGEQTDQWRSSRRGGSIAGTGLPN